MVDDIICIVAICRECKRAVIYKYVKNQPTASGIPMGSGVGFYNDRPDVEWCADCDSDEPRYLCKVGLYDTPGFLDKCENCEFKFACASSRIEVIYEGVK